MGKMPEGEIFIERRKYKRVDKKFKVNYKLVSMPNEIKNIKEEALKKEAESANISVGGIQIIVDTELQPEQILRIEFKPDGKEESIITFAEVRWCAKDGSLGKYRTGIEFLVLKEEDKNFIAKLVEE